MTYNQSFQASVIELSTIAQDTLELSLKVPEHFDFIAGQYVTVKLSGIKLPIEREEFRDFSLSSSPDELPVVRIAFRTGRSPYKKAIVKLKPEDHVIIDGPKGVFILPKSGPVTLIAGGIGITPFASMFCTAHSFDNHPQSVLHYFNRSAKRAAYLDDLRASSEHVIINAHEGNYSMNLLSEKEIQETKRNWFVAGPPAMVNMVLSDLLASGIPPERIRTEEFSGYV